MLRITVIQMNGMPPAAPLSHDFGDGGGTIGREASNDFVLPDPGRHISRMQAQVQYDGSRYMLIDHGGNPTQLNGRPLGKGASATLRDGDEIGIADYVMRVELLREAGHPGRITRPNLAPEASDPLGLGIDLSAPVPDAAFPPPGAFAGTAAPAAGRLDDDPFAVFASPGGGAQAPASIPAAAPAAAPLDDPFAAFAPPPPPLPQATPAAAGAADPLGIGGLAQGAEASSLDALFGLDTGSASPDPFAGSPLGDPAHTPLSGSTAEDPLALLGGLAPAPAPADTARNDSPLLRDAFTPPRVIDDSPPAAMTPAAPPARPASAPPAAPQGGVVSWATPAAQPGVAPAPAAAPAIGPAADESRVLQTQIVSARPAAAMTPTPPTPQAPAAAAPRAAVADAFSPVTPAPAPATPMAPPAGSDALLAAFARGIGLPRLTPAGGMTPELMEHIGRMLREAVQGTVELLVARAATKREVRADVTMIVSKNNNPLKFSPDVDFALMQLLLPQGTGFLPPDEAMRDAYDDLRAHQIGFVAGMRAALTSLLARFTPAELESRLTSKSLFDSVLPGARKAKLWDLYEQRYEEISREAEDDFHSLFGREFLKAYEAQIDKLQRDRG